MEHVSSATIPIFAVDGIGGSGKSHVCKLVAQTLHEQNYAVLQHKVAGLGNSPRVQVLKQIMWHRHRLMQARTENAKQKEDRQRERIFRMAMRHQVKEFRSRWSPHFHLGLIDRTPLMIWVYAMANNPQNPYLAEIESETLAYTTQLNLKRVFLFDLTPETAYARMIARYCVGHSNVAERVADACNTIGASQSETDEILAKVMDLISESIQPQEFESWDLIPIRVTRRERDLHKKILNRCATEFDIQYTIIDAEQPINVVTHQICSEIICEVRN